MVDRADHIAAFDQIADLLRTAAAANARALAANRGTIAEADIERQLEHSLDRLAAMYGRGLFEGLSAQELFDTAIETELRLALELRAAGGSAPAIAAAVARAGALVDAARRGVRLRVRANPAVTIRRGVYIEALRPAVRAALHAEREPYVAWQGGIVAILPEADLAALRTKGDEVDVLFLDPDELLDLDTRGAMQVPPDRAAMDGELARRLAVARASADRVGDSRDRHLRRQLLRHTVVLRNLRDRLAAEHPAAHAALQPILAEHRAVLESALVAAPPPRTGPGDPLDASIEHERELQRLVARWAAEPDIAGFGARFTAVAAAGTHLADLERHRP